MRSGNADGAKGCRFGRAGQGDMDRHSAGEAMTTGLTRFYPEILHWGGFKLGAGWCNAPRPVLRGLRLEAHGRLWSAMTTLTKLSQQSSTESCAVCGNKHREA